MKETLNNLLSGRFFRKGKKVGGGNRKFPRKRIFNLIKFTLADGTPYESISNLLNISEQGLQFSCYEEFPVQSRLKMTVHFPQKKQDIEMTASIIWIRKAKNVKGVYIAGVKFLEISDRNRALIQSLVEQDNAKS